MSSTDLRVRLTGQDGDGGVSGTRFSSDTQGMASAMRMSFTADGHTWSTTPTGAGLIRRGHCLWTRLGRCHRGQRYVRPDKRYG